MSSSKVYLAGPIPKGDSERKGWKDWREEYKKSLASIKNLEFFNPDEWKDESKPMDLVGYNLHLIKTCDFVIVNGESKMGPGTSQEMVIAKYFAKPVITVLPKDSSHRKSNIVFDGNLLKEWIHPFILTMSDLIVEDIGGAKGWIKEYAKDPKSKDIKDIKIIDKAIEEYRERSR